MEDWLPVARYQLPDWADKTIGNSNFLVDHDKHPAWQLATGNWQLATDKRQLEFPYSIISNTSPKGWSLSTKIPFTPAASPAITSRSRSPIKYDLVASI